MGFAASGRAGRTAKAFRIAAAATLAALSRAPAQDTASTAARNASGLWAGAAISSTWVRFGDEASTGRWAGRVDFGYRFRSLCVPWLPVLCWQRVAWLQPLRLTAGVTLVATDIRGMDPVRDRYAYANFDPLGLRATYPALGTSRLFVEARRGTRTAERAEGGRARNYSGSGTTWGGGIEIPLTSSGRGLTMGASYGRSVFTVSEFAKRDRPEQLRHRAVVAHIGWSGPFTGISLPWQ